MLIKRISVSLFTLACAATLVFAANSAMKEGYALGEKVPSFNLTGIDGKSYSLDSFKGKNIVVLDFWSCQCPVSEKYEAYMKKLSADYAAKGITFLALDANVTESKNDIASIAKKRDVNFPILLDVNHTIADKFEAQHTPELFILDKNGVVQYHGGPDSQTSSIYKDYARQAIDEILAGKSVSVKETRAFGCSIKR